jgi:hypothetical protein
MSFINTNEQPAVFGILSKKKRRDFRRLASKAVLLTPAHDNQSAIFWLFSPGR